MPLRVLGTVERSIDHVLIAGSTMLSFNTKSESVDIWSLSGTELAHACPLADPTSSKRSVWSCTEHQTAPFVDAARNLVFAMSPQVLNQRDTVRVFRLADRQLVPSTSIRISSDLPVNIYRYSLQSNGTLLIAANEGEDHDEEEYEEEDSDGVIAKILLCDPTKEKSPILKEIVWHRQHDPFFDSLTLLPSGSIVATESHHHMVHAQGEYGVTLHQWELPSANDTHLGSPSRTIELFPTLIPQPDVFLSTEITASLLTSNALVLCAVESVMGVLPSATSHQTCIRALDCDTLKEKWCAEPISGSISALHYLRTAGSLVAFGSHNQGSEGVGDWSLTVTVLDAETGRTQCAERLNYKAFGRRRVSCSVAAADTHAPTINILFDNGTLSSIALPRFLEVGFGELDSTVVKAVEKDPKILRGAIDERTAVFVRDGQFTAVTW